MLTVVDFLYTVVSGPRPAYYLAASGVRKRLYERISTDDLPSHLISTLSFDASIQKRFLTANKNTYIFDYGGYVNFFRQIFLKVL